MRNPNGYGTVKKLTGKRRKPYAAYITQGFEIVSQKPSISFLKKYISQELYSMVESEYYADGKPYKAKQKLFCLGYFATRQEAMIALAKHNKNPINVDMASLTFADIYQILYEQDYQHRGKSSKSVYVAAFNKCADLHSMRLRDIKLVHLQSVLDKYKNTSAATQGNIIVLYRAICRYAIENDIIEKDYSDYVKASSGRKKKEKRPFAKDEIMLVKENLDWIQSAEKENILTGIPMMDSIIMMIYTGVRISELLGIKVEDVHLDERWIDLRGTKTQAAKRIVPIHKDLIPIIEKRLSRCTGEYLFTDVENQQVKYAQYMKYFYSLFMDHFYIQRTPHECRHTFISIAAASEMNKTLLKKIVGHSTTDITDKVYTHAYIEDLIREIDRFEV